MRTIAPGSYEEREERGHREYTTGDGCFLGMLISLVLWFIFFYGVSLFFLWVIRVSTGMPPDDPSGYSSELSYETSGSWSSAATGIGVGAWPRHTRSSRTPR